MKHIGDITKLNGAEIEPVWCITGGSPCQDLSVAGKRAGLSGERSGLFMEQIRVTKEMREHDRSIGRTDELIGPRFLVWENVSGVYSSNFRDGFGDFGAVLEEVVRIAEPGFSLPRLSGKQKWTKAGAIDGDGWSVAWRTHDAQYWGVPQRRRRISLVADFGGQCAGEILFERESVSGDSEPGEPTRKEASGDLGKGTAVDDRTEEITACAGFSPQQGTTANGIGWQEERSPTLRSVLCGFPLPGVVYALKMPGQTLIQPIVYGVDGYNAALTGDASSCLGVNCGMSTGRNGVAYGIGNGQTAEALDMQEEKAQTLNCMHDRQAVCYGIGGYNSAGMLSSNPNSGIYEAETIRTLDLNGGTPACNQGGIAVCERIIRWIVRRLTPLECERLQGYPDGWTDIGDWTDSQGRKRRESDSPRYKALGNSIALPFWYWMTKRMAQFLPEGATLGSLFDGIGGFPLCWETVHGKGTARWASEIEEFPIAVTKLRFPEED